MKIYQILNRCLATIALVLLSTSILGNEPGPVAEGAEIYNLNCVRCHNARPAEDYTAKQWSVVMPHMREKAHLTKQETLFVETFLASTLTADKLHDTTDHLADLSGEQLFHQFGCQGCHKIGDTGGSLGPNLTSVVDVKGREFVLNKLINPTFNNRASSMPRYPLNEDQLDAITSYLEAMGTGIAEIE